MRTLLFSLAAAASALAFASPASAQYYPQPQGYGHGYGYGQGHGYNASRNQYQVRVFMGRINELQRDVYRLDREGRLSSRDAGRIHHQAEALRQRLMHASYNGLNRRERVEFDHRLDRLRAHMRHEMRQYRRNDRRWDRDDRRDRRDDRYDWRGRRR